MTGRWPWILIASLAVVASLMWFWMFEPSLKKFLMALFLIIVCAPIKGLVYDRFKLVRPYRLALAANAASTLTGLSFHMGFDFWSLILASTGISAILETMVLIGFNACHRLGRALLIASYATLVIHLITAGFLAWSRGPVISAVAILIGIVLAHPPGILTDVREISSGRAV